MGLYEVPLSTALLGFGGKEFESWITGVCSPYVVSLCASVIYFRGCQENRKKCFLNDNILTRLHVVHTFYTVNPPPVVFIIPRCVCIHVE